MKTICGIREQPAPVRCEYCDGTGDVHSIDGEWRGRCSCEAGAPESYWDRDIVDRLMERAAVARAEGTGTATGDAAHFEEAALLIRRLRHDAPPSNHLADASPKSNSHEGTSR